MRNTIGYLILANIALLLTVPFAFGQDETLLLQQPTISINHVAFVYAGDIWIADRDGGNAKRLTVHKGIESRPYFSPDGKWIAFSGDYDGNIDVYIISVEGGSPQRLTFHPNYDVVRGWTPDGKRVLFTSIRDTSHYQARLYTISLAGGFPEALPMPMAARAAFSPDGRYIAYTPIYDHSATWPWRCYRGGSTTRIWIFDLQSFEIEEIPHENADNTFPIWLGDTIYFLSDRSCVMNLFAYDTKTKEIQQVTRYEDFDIKWASGFSDTIVYEQAGRLHLLSISDRTTRTIKIKAIGDLPDIRPHYKNVSDRINYGHISPNGVRAVLETRGDIFTVPAKKGDIRNLTQTPGANERSPCWSPDGKWIAYLSDASGEYQLMISEQKGMEKPMVYSLGKPSFYYYPKWSPDSRKILYSDKSLNFSI